MCTYEACSASEAVLSFPISDLGADGAGSFSLLIWMLHASASWFDDFRRVVPVPGLSHWDKPLGQAQPVPVGQADSDKLCLSKWDKHSLSKLGLGKVKRDLSLSHGTSHIPTLEAFPCPWTSSIPTMELVPVPLVPTCPTKWVYKTVKFLLWKRTAQGWTNRTLAVHEQVNSRYLVLPGSLFIFTPDYQGRI